ncbi:methyl-accepting chemotaxis protein [Brevibacillus laterosporus]|uniref:Methyl-accepting chemotaxis protein n=1 Tax=Brevibacillus laterosporus TaxID=1465 RepID=A0A518V5H8_BRELA|nr:methyl-accepting chemotaxis protein [Brevibacillus laterosporus]
MIEKLRNVSVGKKLSLLIGSLILFVAIANAMSINVLNTITKNTDQILEDRLVPSIILGSYASLNQYLHVKILEDMLESDLQKSRNIEKEALETLEKNKQHLAAYKETRLSPEEEVLINSMLSIYPKYTDAVTHTLELTSDNKNQEAYEFFKTKGLTILEEMDKLVDDLYELNIQLAEQVSEESSKEASNTRSLLIFITILLMAIGAFLGIAFARMIIRPLKKVSEVMKKTEEGDFTQKVDYAYADEIGQTAQAIDRMLHTLNGFTKQIAEATQQITVSSEQLNVSTSQTSTASEHIAANAQEVAEGTEYQVQLVEEATESLNKMAQKTNVVITSQVASVGEAVGYASQKSMEGNQAIEAAVCQMQSIHRVISNLEHAIQGLNKRSSEIEQIVDVISEIGKQTNLLALNATIEAARAGEHGRGFIVVADEVRKLAEQSANSAKRIGELINAIQDETAHAVHSMQRTTNEVTNGATAVGEVGKLFEEIQTSVDEVANQIKNVTSSVHSMTLDAEKIQSAVQSINDAALHSSSGSQNISAATQEQLVSMEEISASTGILSQIVADLRTQLNKFKV